MFALNETVYTFSNFKRKAAVEALRRAVTSQILIADITQSLTNTQKQIAMLNQSVADSGEGAGADEIKVFQAEMTVVYGKIQELSVLSDPGMRQQVGDFAKDFKSLSASWVVFYQNFGVRYATAITELALRGDPLSQRLLQQTVPAIVAGEKQRVDEASATYYATSDFADRVTAIIFAFSTLLAIVVAIKLSRHLVVGFHDLKTGADQIGAGDFDYRIAIRAHDELGDLAEAFNAMNNQLGVARTNLFQANDELAIRHKEVLRQRELSDSLLLNILPTQIADELRDRGLVDPKYFEDVTILFTDFVGFSNSTRNLSAEDLVYLLHDYFTAFDTIAARYGLEKLKTIGDSYMAVGGMPARTPSHPVDVVMAAFEMLEAVKERAHTGPGWGVRIGIHTGPVIAGVVGIRKFAFDVWGESVNLASRMESSGAANCINISKQTHARAKDFFVLEERGSIMTKDKISHEMYFVKGVLPALLDGDTAIPPAPFARRYGIYFQKEPPAFPAFLTKLSC